MTFSLIVSMVSGILDQLQIFSQLYLVELLWLLTGLELLELLHWIYLRFLTEFDILVLYTNFSLMKFQVRYLASFLLFSAIDGLEWFWMESLHNNIQLMLDFLKTQFLVLHFSCCILMTFLMMLSVISQSKLMIPFSLLSVIRHLICGSNLNWLLNLNLINETLWIGVMLGKLSWFRLTGLITLVLLM